MRRISKPIWSRNLLKQLQDSKEIGQYQEVLFIQECLKLIPDQWILLKNYKLQKSLKNLLWTEDFKRKLSKKNFLRVKMESLKRWLWTNSFGQSNIAQDNFPWNLFHLKYRKFDFDIHSKQRKNG